MRRTYCDRCDCETTNPVLVHAAHRRDEEHQHYDLCDGCWLSVVDLIHDHQREPV